MEDTQLIIVLAAMSALISVVAIAIDWIGKPLRHKQFIPKMYRYEDEEFVSSHDFAEEYDVAQSQLAHEPAQTPLAQDVQLITQLGELQMPVQYASSTTAHSVQGAAAKDTAAKDAAAQGVHSVVDAAERSVQSAPAISTFGAAITSTPQNVNAAEVEQTPLVVPGLDFAGDHITELDTQPTPAVSPFSAALAQESEVRPTHGDDGSERDTFRQAKIASTQPVESVKVWDISMPLDIRVQDKLPTLALKANRFWKARAADRIAVDQFGVEALIRMREGKAPQRRNPRTGEFETPDVFGLRSASTHSDVQVRWPNTSTDPWSS